MKCLGGFLELNICALYAHMSNAYTMCLPFVKQKLGSCKERTSPLCGSNLNRNH